MKELTEEELQNLKNKYYSHIVTRMVVPVIAAILSFIFLVCHGILWGFLIILICGVIFVFALGSLMDSCPECKGWNSLIELEREETGRERTTITEERKTNKYNSKREFIGYETQKVEVPAIRIFYHVIYKCKVCEQIIEKEQSSTHKI